MMMTPMIDVCFQMIIFFVANMRIVAAEGDFSMTMAGAASPAQHTFADNAQMPRIKIHLRAAADGNLAGIRLGNRPIGSFQELRDQMRQLCGVDRGPGVKPSDTEAELDFDDNLKYAYVVDAITYISGFRSDDGHTIIPLIDKIKFAPPRKNRATDGPPSPVRVKGKAN
jgi:biopolymer transport protein ExbD